MVSCGDRQRSHKHVCDSLNNAARNSVFQCGKCGNCFKKIKKENDISKSGCPKLATNVDQVVLISQWSLEQIQTMNTCFKS